MHYKDGTEAKLGDIVQHDSGAVGIIIGGTIGSDYCTTQAVMFHPEKDSRGANYGYRYGAGYTGRLDDGAGNTVARSAVHVAHDQSMQTRECLKIGHVDIGHG